MITFLMVSLWCGALDVSDNYIPFIYDGENPIGVSYIYNSKDSAESLEWYVVSDSRIIKTFAQMDCRG
jgi:hypothetical protein